MSSFPKTYLMVRSGTVGQVAVANLDELLRLRTELAILERFGRGSSDQVVSAIEERVQTARAGDHREQEVAELEELLQILEDAANPIVRETATGIDAEIPEVSEAVQLQTVRREAEGFYRSVAEAIGASGLPDAQALARTYLTATGAEPGPSTATDVASDGDQDVTEPTHVQTQAEDANAEPAGQTQAGLEVAPDKADTDLAEADAVVQPDPAPPEQSEAAAEPDATDPTENLDVDQILDSLTDEVEAITSEYPPDPEPEATRPEPSAGAEDLPDISDVEPAAEIDEPTTEEPPIPDAEEGVDGTPDTPQGEALTVPVSGDEGQDQAATEPVETTAGVTADEAVTDVASETAETEPPLDQAGATIEDADLTTAEADAPAEDAASAIESTADVDASPEASPTTGLRAELHDIRSALTDQMDRLATVLDQMEAVRSQARGALAEANRLQEAAQAEAAAVLGAKETYAQAQQQALHARAAAFQAETWAKSARKDLERFLDGGGGV